VATDPEFVFDFDSHYYEAADAFTRYIDEEYRVRSVRFETGPNNENRLFVNDEPSIDYPDFYPPVDPDAGTDDYFASLAVDRTAEPAQAVGRKPEFFGAVPLAWKNRDARLALLDEQGVDASLLLPSVGVTYQDQVKDDPDLLHAINRSFNRWLEDDWGYAYRDRIFAVPSLCLDDLDQTLDELERLIDVGARIVNLPVAPVRGHSPASTRFDPFWQAVSDANIVVAFHLSAGPYGDVMRDLWGNDLIPADTRREAQSAFFWATAFGDRPIMDLMTSLVFWNLFGRFPALRVASIENGAGWVEYLLSRMDKMALVGRHGAWPGGPLDALPSEVFHRHVFVVPFPEENIVRAVRRVGADRLLFGSDYPHPEGLANPRSIVPRLEDLAPEDLQRVIGGNAAMLMGLDGPDPVRG
jgi:predicted TIM-barrel fold metal-dependent hydrolase